VLGDRDVDSAHVFQRLFMDGTGMCRQINSAERENDETVLHGIFADYAPHCRVHSLFDDSGTETALVQKTTSRLSKTAANLETVSSTAAARRSSSHLREGVNRQRRNAPDQQSLIQKVLNLLSVSA